MTIRRLKTISLGFAPDQLTLAREAKGLLKKELAASIGVSPTAVTCWENGSKNPTEESIFQLSVVLEVEPEFFHSSTQAFHPTTSFPHFRSLRATPQKTRKQAKAFGELAAIASQVIEKYVEFPQVNLPITLLEESDGSERYSPRAVAANIRKHWGLGSAPISKFLHTAERNGVIVVFSHMDSASVDAYSFWAGERPLVVLNPLKNDFYRQRFDLGHEIAHLAMHTDESAGEKQAESEANEFSGELLAPRDVLIPQFPHSLNEKGWRRLFELKEEWGISVQALLFLMRKEGQLSENSYRNAMISLTKKGWRRAEPGMKSHVEVPSLLQKAVRLLEENSISRVDLAKECGMRLETFDQITQGSFVPPHFKLEI